MNSFGFGAGNAYNSYGNNNSNTYSSNPSSSIGFNLASSNPYSYGSPAAFSNNSYGSSSAGPVLQGGFGASSANPYSYNNNSYSSNSNAQAPKLSAEEMLLEKHGLTWRSVEATQGSKGADMMDNTLSLLAERQGMSMLPTPSKVALASGILMWQSAVSAQIRAGVYERCYLAMLEVVQTTLLEPDDWTSPTSYAQGAQMPALYLARSLLVQCQESSSFLEKILAQLLFTFEYVLEHKVSLQEKDEFLSDNAASVRADTLKTLFRCTGTHAIEDKENQQALAALTVRLLNYTGKSYVQTPLFREEILKRLVVLGNLDHTLLEKNIPEVLVAIREGERDLIPVVKKNPAVMEMNSELVSGHLEDLVDALGIADVTELIMELVEQQPAKLLKAVPALVREIQYCLPEYQLVILNALMAAGLVDPAVIAPHLAALQFVCSSNATLHIAYFKVMVVACSASADALLECLSSLAKLAKSGTIADPMTKAALLDAVNTAKDYCKFSDVFQDDTLRAFESFSVYNQKAYSNIIRWNKGKTVRQGNRKEFLKNNYKARDSSYHFRLPHFGTSSPTKSVAASDAQSVDTSNTERKSSIGMSLLRRFSRHKPAEEPNHVPSNVGTPENVHGIGEKTGMTPQSQLQGVKLFDDATNTSESNDASGTMSFAEFCARQAAGGTGTSVQSAKREIQIAEVGTKKENNPFLPLKASSDPLGGPPSTAPSSSAADATLDFAPIEQNLGNSAAVSQVPDIFAPIEYNPTFLSFDGPVVDSNNNDDDSVLQFDFSEDIKKGLIPGGAGLGTSDTRSATGTSDLSPQKKTIKFNLLSSAIKAMSGRKKGNTVREDPGNNASPGTVGSHTDMPSPLPSLGSGRNRIAPAPTVGQNGGSFRNTSARMNNSGTISGNSVGNTALEDPAEEIRRLRQRLAELEARRFQ